MPTRKDIGSLKFEAPIAGLVLRILVSPGDEVSRGQDIVVIEAMKTELNLAAEGDAIVESILVAPDEIVQEGQILVTFKQT